MNILVAGGAGFIGSHLVDRLLSQGHHVDVIDNLVTGSEKNIAHLADHPNFKFIPGDITTDILDGAYEQIYNMASPASPVDFANIPIEILMTGSIGQKNLLDLAKKNQARILFASTSEVYGDPLVHPQTEDYYGNVNCTGARACYDEAKRFGEALTYNYLRHRNVDTRVVRIFNTYGPRMSPNDGRVIPNFFTQAIGGEKLTIYGDGSQTRSLCYVDDMVEGIVRLMESDVTIPVNIGNPIEMTVKEIGDMVKEVTGISSEYSYHPLPENDPKQRRPDTTRAKELLGWSAQVDPRVGLEKTYQYFQEIL
jgi:dTDP-glucose 4,6-dehydratase